jgi:aurora kinase
MATRTLETRFERMSVNDENDPGDGTKVYEKTKASCISRQRFS